ncbi:MAG: alpha/beta hydrolase [Cyclobacteriaceae bacterium]|nr:alpha/beta hydrolase [Cyclobacteriaceae bacterium]
MRAKIILILLLIVTGLAIFYLYPVKRVNLETLYPDSVFTQLNQVRQEPVQQITASGPTWTYLVTGRGDTTLLFLHGMGGSYDIWFQQISHFKNRYRIISVEYPPVHSLKDLGSGIVGILDKEAVQRAVVIGSSLGGYLAQYLTANYPDRVLMVSLGNTFPPNTEIKEKNAGLIRLLRILPEWLVIGQMRNRYEEEILPASGNSPTATAFLLTLLGTKVNKQNLLARYHCVVDYFDTPVPDSIPVQIIESDNDPLVSSSLREALKARYPTARVVTLNAQGHFPYLSHARQYNAILEKFITQTND